MSEAGHGRASQGCGLRLSLAIVVGSLEYESFLGVVASICTPLPHCVRVIPGIIKRYPW